EATQPYREAAVFLLAKYKQRTGWHCVVMPVTSDEARIGGIRYLGFPKIMGDVRLEREPASYTGSLTLNNKKVLTVQLSPRDVVSPSEEGWFKRFQGLPNFNILNGKVYEPEFGGKANALDVSRLYPDKFIVRTGAAKLIQDAEAAGEHSARLAKIFSIKPADIVLAYYMKNSFQLNFGAGSFADQEEQR
ncbi:MAG TPA: acetoacetate decarboxylase family protein, partial [Smithellaceae bacterium]|nr:acetoacetate decarboxylase family protein [Smithellaceae bacterium]